MTGQEQQKIRLRSQRQTVNKKMKGSGSYMLFRKTAFHILIILLDPSHQGTPSSLSMKNSDCKIRNLESIQSRYDDCEDTEVFRMDLGAMLRELAYIANVKSAGNNTRYKIFEKHTTSNVRTADIVIRHDTEIQRYKAGYQGLEQELGFEANAFCYWCRGMGVSRRIESTAK